MDYINTVSTNLKGAQRTYKLGQRTLIVGENESGKSAIAQSCQLVVNKAASGVMFRGSVAKADYVRTMGPRNGTLSISAQTSQGKQYSYTLGTKGNPKHDGPDTAMPTTEDIRDAFTGTVPKLYAFLAQYVPGHKVTKAQVEWAIGTSMEANYALGPVADDMTLLEVIEMQGRAAKVLTSSKALYEAAKETPRVLPPEPPPTDAEYEEAKQALFNLVTQYKVREMGKTFDRDTVERPAFALTYRTMFGAAGNIGDSAVPNAVAKYEDIVIRRAGGAHKSEVIDFEKTASVIAAWGQVVERFAVVIAQAALHHINAFEEAVTAYLRADERLLIDVKGATLVNLLRSGVPFAALSGSTEVRILSAMASALATMNQSDIALVVPEDRAWSARNLTRTMEDLADSECQIILMSTVMPLEEVSGWTVIEL